MIRFLFIILSFNLFGQIEIINKSLFKPHEKVLYQPAYNNLEVVGIQLDSTYTIVSNLDTLRFYDNHISYTGYPQIKNDIITLKLGDSIIHQEQFIVKYLPRFYYLGSLRDSFVTKKYLLSNPGLIFTHNPETYRPCSSIQSFSALILRSNKQSELSTNLLENWSEKQLLQFYRGTYGNKFSKSQLRKIKKMKSGDLIWFMAVVMSCPSCVATRKSINLKLTIIPDSHVK